MSTCTNRKVGKALGLSPWRGLFCHSCIVEGEHEVTAMLNCTAPPSSHTTYMVKTSPLPQISISRLAAEYGATEFLPALETFLKDHMPANRLKLSTFDQFDLSN